MERRLLLDADQSRVNRRHRWRGDPELVAAPEQEREGDQDGACARPSEWIARHPR